MTRNAAPMPDLFAFDGGAATPPRAPAAVPPAACLPVPRSAGSHAWEAVLAQLETDRLMIHVSALWTGVVIEVAAGAAIGHKMWCRDGVIADLGGNSRDGFGRHAYLTARRAGELHRAHGLRLVGQPGEVSARFRFAGGEACDDTPAVLQRLAAATRSGFL